MYVHIVLGPTFIICVESLKRVMSSCEIIENYHNYTWYGRSTQISSFPLAKTKVCSFLRIMLNIDEILSCDSAFRSVGDVLSKIVCDTGVEIDLCLYI